MSYTFRRISYRRSERTWLSYSADTAFKRCSMAARDSSGCSTQRRSRRPPMAVAVLSSSHSRLPRVVRLCSPSVNSRLRRVAASRGMVWFSLKMRSAVICVMAFFCVSDRYRISAPAACAAGRSVASRPSAVSEFTPKCSQSISLAFAPRNAVCGQEPMEASDSGWTVSGALVMISRGAMAASAPRSSRSSLES